jgi:hypothetical protein
LGQAPLPDAGGITCVDGFRQSTVVEVDVSDEDGALGVVPQVMARPFSRRSMDSEVTNYSRNARLSIQRFQPFRSDRDLIKSSFTIHEPSNTIAYVKNPQFQTVLRVPKGHPSRVPRLNRTVSPSSRPHCA